MSQLDDSAISVLRELQSTTGRNLIGELVELYIASTPAVIQKMRSDLAKSLFKDLSREAHSLKSSSANLGVREIESLSKQIEFSIVKNGSTNAKELGQWIDEIEKSFVLAKVELEKL